MSRTDQHAFRRLLWTVEEAQLVAGSPSSAAEIERTLMPLAEKIGARERVADLAAVGAGRMPAEDYMVRHGVAGVRRFASAGGRVIFLLPVETFPNHVNNVYLVIDGARRTLVDAGSQMPSAREGFARVARVLETTYAMPGVLDALDEVVVTHGHIDHYGGVGEWRKQGARVAMHELDARVLTRFDERIVVAALGLHRFLVGAGVEEPERHELERMYVIGKSMFKPVPVDRVLVDGDHVADMIAHHVPGHCPGHICLQVDEILLTADHVLARITPHQAPESITASTGLDHYFDSLEKIRRVRGIELALPAHEEPITALAERITEIELFHRGRLARVREICATEGRTIRDITHILFGEQQGYGRILAYEEAGAHVEWLARRGHLEIANLEEFQTVENPVIKYRAA